MAHADANKKSSALEKDSRKEMSLLANIIMVVAAIVVLIIGGIFMRNLFRERQTGKESLNWPQTEGLVMRSEYNQRRHDSNARISYRYVVNGKAFFSTQVNVAKDYMLSEPRLFVEKHPAGTKIPVFYNSEHPGVSVLVPGIDSENTTLLVLFGALLIFLCLSSLAVVFQIIRRVFFRQASHSHA